MTIKNQSTNIYIKTICIIQENINTNKVRLRDFMRFNMNRKEKYMLKEEEVMEDIKLKLSREERRRKRKKKTQN